MKQIVRDYQEIKKVSVKDLNRACHSQTMIAYVTSAGNGMAVLKQDSDECWGFMYHKDLVMSNYDKDLKFLSSSKIGAIKNVLDANRQLMMFDDFDEFVKFAADKTKL